MTDAIRAPAQAEARSWIDRWDAQQEIYMPDREERFTALVDAVEERVGRPDPLVLDLGCGPGSLAVRVLDRIPSATVIAIDADPLLLALGRAAWAQRAPRSGSSPVGRDPGSRPAPGTAPGVGIAMGAGLIFADHDLRGPGWSAALRLDRAVDAAVSTTALHWLSPDALASLYAEVATILRPGGILLNGDHLTEDESTAPTLVRLGRALIEREDRRHARPGSRETWAQWWDAVAANPALADLVAARQRQMLDTGHHGSPSGRLDTHVGALRAAGFAEIGTLWQRGDNRLLCAIAGP